MTGNYSAEAARIRAMTTSMVSILDGAQEEPIAFAQIEQGARLLTEAYQDVLNLGTKQLVSESTPQYNSTLLTIEEGYENWRLIRGAFARTLRLAYNGYIPRDHMQMDTVLAQLEHQVGNRITALHHKLQASWKSHVDDCPWDDFMVSEHTTREENDLKTNLRMLIQGDHLDVEDAVEELTGALRYNFADFLSHETDALDLLEEGLWMRPEILLVNDYWRSNRDVRILELLAGKERSRRASGFAQMMSLLSYDEGAQTPNFVMRELESIRPDEKDTFYRCLMLHPDHEIRRFAANNVDIDGFWKVVTPSAVPCATILAMLERVARSQYYDENFQKLFFNAIHRRLFNLTSRSEVLYARGIVRIFTEFPFFMEDEYFEKLTVLFDYVTAKEKIFCDDRGMLDEFRDNLHREKDKIGTLLGQTPLLTSVPPVVLRKLARDGHYWYDLSMHPMFKIARETISHITTTERAVRVAKNHVVNQDVLRAIGKNRTLFTTQTSKIALLSNPRTPPTVSIGYVADLSTADMTNLLRKGTVHPELRLQLRNRLSRR